MKKVFVTMACVWFSILSTSSYAQSSGIDMSTNPLEGVPVLLKTISSDGNHLVDTTTSRIVVTLKNPLTIFYGEAFRVKEISFIKGDRMVSKHGVSGLEALIANALSVLATFSPDKMTITNNGAIQLYLYAQRAAEARRGETPTGEVEKRAPDIISIEKQVNDWGTTLQIKISTLHEIANSDAQEISFVLDVVSAHDFHDDQEIRMIENPANRVKKELHTIQRVVRSPNFSPTESKQNIFGPFTEVTSYEIPGTTTKFIRFGRDRNVFLPGYSTAGKRWVKKELEQLISEFNGFDFLNNKHVTEIVVATVVVTVIFPDHFDVMALTNVDQSSCFSSYVESKKMQDTVWLYFEKGDDELKETYLGITSLARLKCRGGETDPIKLFESGLIIQTTPNIVPDKL